MNMSKHKFYLSAILSTLLFSGVAIADGTTPDLESDMINGHSANHKDPELVHNTPAQAPDVTHSDGKDDTDMIHQMSVDKEKLSSSPSSPPDQHHATGDNSQNMIHEVSEHAGS